MCGKEIEDEKAGGKRESICGQVWLEEGGGTLYAEDGTRRMDMNIWRLELLCTLVST